MGKKKINKAFLSEYVQLDKVCCAKFGVTSGGVTEYINRLNNARFAPGRDDALARLVRYRNIRNRFAHELISLRKAGEIVKADVKWIRSFGKAIEKKKDPISRYLNRARKFARRRKIRRTIIVLGLVGAAAAAVALLLL